MPAKVFELLRKKKLHSLQNLKNELGKMSLARIKDLSDEISDASRELDLARVGPADESAFNFTVSPDAFLGPCIQWECKLARADEFLRYAILYADAIALPNIFARYSHVDDLTPIQLDLLQYRLLGDILVLWKLKPIIDAGIAAFVPDTITLCEEHSRELETTWDSIERRLIRSAKSLQHKIAPDTQMALRANEQGITYSIGLPKQFLENNYISLEPEPPPEWLRRTRNYKTAYQSGEFAQLSPRQIERLGAILPSLLEIRVPARTYLFSRIFMSSKYLTSRPVDALLLDDALTDPKLRQVSRNISECIPLKMPIIEGVDARTLLKIRHQDYDAFLNYRSAIVEVESEYIKRKRKLSKADALGLYEDVVFPNLRRLEVKANMIKRELRSSASKRIVVAATLAVAGIALGILPHDATRVLEIVGACEMIGPVADLWKSTGTPNEVKSDPFYFLWNIERYHRHAVRH